MKKIVFTFIAFFCFLTISFAQLPTIHYTGGSPQGNHLVVSLDSYSQVKLNFTGWQNITFIKVTWTYNNGSSYEQNVPVYALGQYGSLEVTIPRMSEHFEIEVSGRVLVGYPNSGDFWIHQQYDIF